MAAAADILEEVRQIKLDCNFDKSYFLDPSHTNFLSCSFSLC